MTATRQDPQDVVKVYSGPLVNVESYRAACVEEGIACNVVGTERDVAALIAQPGQLRQSLLGMSFLNRLEGWEVRGDRLVLRAYP